jgi:hypothetical protein
MRAVDHVCMYQCAGRHELLAESCTAEEARHPPVAKSSPSRELRGHC